MSTELNKKLLESLKDELYWGDYNDSDMMQDAANECEKICLQEKIDLLDDVIKAIIKHNDIWATHGYASLAKQQLQKQFNQLNNGNTSVNTD